MNLYHTRECLSREDKLRRSYYEVLRDELDQFALENSLMTSYDNFLRHKIPYPFVELRELKPRARIPSTEFDLHTSFLIIFSEGWIGKQHKKYIRYFDANKTTKTNLLAHKQLDNIQDFNRSMKYFENKEFFSLLSSLLPIDYALLIQRDEHVKSQYGLTHFHVRIDWPIAEAAEALARDLRYISKDLYEKGDKYAEDMQKKFFEYHGVPVMAGGRRTAGVVAAQYFRQMPYLSTVYVSSSESRSLLRINETGVSKFVLIRLKAEQIRAIAASADITQTSFTKNYVIARQGRSYVCVFNVLYDYTPHALPSEGGKLRELKAEHNWLTVSHEQIIPKPSILHRRPIPWKMIYV